MDKYIYIKRKALTNNQCKFCINYFEDNENKEEVIFRGYTAICGLIFSDSFVDLKNILTLNINEYVQKHSFLNTLYARWGIENEFNIQKYLPGNAYSGEHMEHGKDEWSSKRLLGWMVYLNNITNKGGTCWPQQNFTSEPREGDLYIWPAAWTHSHYGIPAPQEMKYIMTGWCGFI